MTKADHIQAIEDRAFAARKTMQQVCDRAGVYPSVWSRAKSRGSVGVNVISRMDKALDAIEAEGSSQ